MLSKSQLANYINCQLGLEDLGCLTNFCAAVNRCIDSGDFGNTFSTGLTNVAGTVTANISTGVSGGQTIYGGTGAGESLTISSTAHATKGFVYIGTHAAFDGADQRLGLANQTPTHTLTIGSTGSGIALYNTADQTTNFERARIQRSSNILKITVGAGGSGTARSIRILANSSGDADSTYSAIEIGGSNIIHTMRASPSSTTGHSFVISSGGSSMSSGSLNFMSITPTIAHSGTAGYAALFINVTQTSTGSGSKYIIQGQVGGVNKFTVDNSGVISIGNTVTTESLVSNRSVTISINGTTHKLLAYV